MFRQVQTHSKAERPPEYHQPKRPVVGAGGGMGEDYRKYMFVLNAISLFTMKSFNPIPVAVGNPKQLSRRMTSVPKLASQEWGGCEE